MAYDPITDKLNQAAAGTLRAAAVLAQLILDDVVHATEKIDPTDGDSSPVLSDDPMFGAVFDRLDKSLDRALEAVKMAKAMAGNIDGGAF